jgi:hypothetical protein
VGSDSLHPLRRRQVKSGPARPNHTLIRRLAAQHHEGHPSRMYETLGVSVATANFWARGAVLPSADSVIRLCKVYQLALKDVMELWRRSRRGKLDKATGEGR